MTLKQAIAGARSTRVESLQFLVAAISESPNARIQLEIARIRDDALVEVTPKAIRIRKRYLDPHERKRQPRKAEAA